MAAENPSSTPWSWADLFPWLLLLRTFRLAKELPKLALAGLGLFATTLGWRVLGRVFSGDPKLDNLIRAYRLWPWQPESPLANTTGMTRAATRTAEVLGVADLLGADGIAWLSRNPVADTWELLSRPVRGLFAQGLPLTGVAYLLLCSLWTIVVWSVVGGAIARIAAVQLAREERPSLKEGISFAAARWAQYFWAPLVPLVLVVAVVIVASMGSWLLRFDSGLLLAAVAWPLWLGAGLVMAIVSLGLIVGWPLMWATISVEASDSFDGIARAYAYVFQRPLHLLAYTLFSGIYGILGWILVGSLAAATVYLTIWGASWTAGRQRTAAIVDELPSSVLMVPWRPSAATARAGILAPSSTSPSDAEPSARSSAPNSRLGRAGLSLLACWLALVKLLALGFSPSFFWTAVTATYFLLRRDTDHRELDEVALERPVEPFGLPKLAADAAGVPVVAPPEADDLSPSQLAAAQTEASLTETAAASAPAKMSSGTSSETTTWSSATIDLTDSRAADDGG